MLPVETQQDSLRAAPRTKTRHRDTPLPPSLRGIVLFFIELRIEHHDAGSGITMGWDSPHSPGGDEGIGLPPPPGVFVPFPFELITLRIGLPNGRLGYPMAGLVFKERQG